MGYHHHSNTESLQHQPFFYALSSPSLRPPFPLFCCPHLKAEEGCSQLLLQQLPKGRQWHVEAVDAVFVVCSQLLLLGSKATPLVVCAKLLLQRGRTGRAQQVQGTLLQDRLRRGAAAGSLFTLLTCVPNPCQHLVHVNASRGPYPPAHPHPT